jgi:hypothetical protein
MVFHCNLKWQSCETKTLLLLRLYTCITPQSRRVFLLFGHSKGERRTTFVKSYGIKRGAIGNLWKTDWAASVPSFWFLPFFFLDTNGKNPLHRKVPSYVWGHQILELYSHLLHLIPTKYWRLTQFDRHDLNFRHPSPHVMEYDLQGTSSITDGQCWFWNS